MDYVVGSVAALISGNVTPNRPKLIRRALTPTKHQPSPNVTPKSEMVEDRSVFLSPTLQKKKAIVKKSPKRIFQNPDLDVTGDSDRDSTLSSPKAAAVKKHLKEQLDGGTVENTSYKAAKSPKNKNKTTLNSSLDEKNVNDENIEINFSQSNEVTPKKKKKKSLSEIVDESVSESQDVTQKSPSDMDMESSETKKKSPKMKERRKSTVDETKVMEAGQTSLKQTTENNDSVKYKSNKRKMDSEIGQDVPAKDIKENSTDKLSKSQKHRLRKKLRLQKRKSNSKQSNTQSVGTDQSKEKNENNESKIKQNKKIETASNSESKENVNNENLNPNTNQDENLQKKSSKRKNKSKNKNSNINTENQTNGNDEVPEEINNSEEQGPVENLNNKSIKKNKNTENILQEETTKVMEITKNKKLKSKSKDLNKANTEVKEHKEKKKNFVNPNAITDKDSDSEHESDDNIESENEEDNKKALEETTLADQSSDEEEEEPVKEKIKTENVERKTDADEIKRTLFVGNVPFNTKCKKQIKKIFNKYGKIETVRIRTVPVKDARVTPKLAVIKNELHPERTTVNMYIKYTESESVEKALVENNTVLDGNHLRVTRSDSTGAEHDPRLAVFVGNLPFAIEDDTLRAKFEGCGQIESVRIIRDKKTNAGKGFGYVNFASKDGVELALAVSEEDLTIKNRILRVKRCTQMTHKQPQRHVNPKWAPKQEGEGAFRRIMHKRQHQDPNMDGPPNKRAKNINQPFKEKKPRQEFVGMTAEKKKKHKFDKGQKKKKALSQVLTNNKF